MGQNPFQNFLVRFNRGDRVFAEGEKGRTMFIVQSGLVGMYREVDGERRQLGTLEKGDFFGEMSILEGLPRTASAIAESDAELIEINHSVFDKMIRGNIEIAVRMLRKLSIRLREAEARIVELQASGKQAPVRSAGRTERGVKSAPARVGGARLEAEGKDLVFPLDGDNILVGRYDPVMQLKPDIDLTELDLKRSVSRQHARIALNGAGHVITEEVGALHGTLVNGTKLTPGRSHPLADGDRISVGDVVVVFHS